VKEEGDFDHIEEEMKEEEVPNKKVEEKQ